MHIQEMSSQKCPQDDSLTPHTPYHTATSLACTGFGHLGWPPALLVYPSSETEMEPTLYRENRTPPICDSAAVGTDKGPQEDIKVQNGPHTPLDMLLALEPRL